MAWALIFSCQKSKVFNNAVGKIMEVSIDISAPIPVSGSSNYSESNYHIQLFHMMQFLILSWNKSKGCVNLISEISEGRSDISVPNPEPVTINDMYGDYWR